MKSKSVNLREFLLKNAFIIALVVMYVGFSLSTEGFATLSNFLSIFHNAAPTFAVTIGIAFVILMGQIDISVGSIMLMASTIFCISLGRWGLPVWAAILLMVVITLSCGFINGLIVTKLKIPPMIATLCTQIAFRGVALAISGGLVSSIPQELSQFSSIKIGPVFLDILLVLIMVAVAHLVQNRTRYGRHVMAIGNKEETARKLGIQVDKVVILTYVVSAFFSMIGGLLLAIQISGVFQTFGQGKEFTAIAATVIAGISMNGGEGKILNVIVGVFFLQCLQVGLSFVGISIYAYDFVQGVIIFAAMFINALKGRTGSRAQKIAALPNA